ncbi:MAG TPA: DUF2520 domain-containing protein [Bacteroidales bacterium]|nr:DUF2520 domain-containing protein [Bacteroidales bacterium]
MNTLSPIHSAIVLGTGRMAAFLIPWLRMKGIEVMQVYGRNTDKARGLGKYQEIPWTDKLEDLMQDADLYILAVADEAIPGLGSRLHDCRGIVAHTSGAVPLDALSSCPHHGVFYPVQTVGRYPLPRVEDIPVCVEGADEKDTLALKGLAERMSERALILDSKQRLHLHLAAVLVNNFTNHLYARAGALLKREGLPFDLLHPLLLRTAELACRSEAATLQTGPALRGDEATIRRHLTVLRDDPTLEGLYVILTQAIREMAENQA